MPATRESIIIFSISNAKPCHLIVKTSWREATKVLSKIFPLWDKCRIFSPDWRTTESTTTKENWTKLSSDRHEIGDNVWEIWWKCIQIIAKLRENNNMSKVTWHVNHWDFAVFVSPSIKSCRDIISYYFPVSPTLSRRISVFSRYFLLTFKYK